MCSICQQSSHRALCLTVYKCYLLHWEPTIRQSARLAMTTVTTRCLPENCKAYRKIQMFLYRFQQVATSGISWLLSSRRGCRANNRCPCLRGRGGKLAALRDCLCVPSRKTARIQECHILIEHIICELLEQQYFKK